MVTAPWANACSFCISISRWTFVHLTLRTTGTSPSRNPLGASGGHSAGQKADMKSIIIFVTLFVTTLANAQKCGDKIVGIHNRSTTAKESRTNGVFQFQMVADKKTFVLDSSWTFQINDSWVENTWTYKCVDSKPVVDKENSFQLVVEPNTKQSKQRFDYILSIEGSRSSTFLSSKPPIEFKCQGGDSVVLLLKKFNKPLIDTTTTLVGRIKFTKVNR